MNPAEHNAAPDLQARYQAVRDRLATACQTARRNISDVALLAVSKTRPATNVADVFDQGQRSFGENYVQEWADKRETLRELEEQGLQWHIIGPLQRNKCKYVAGQVSLIHTVHSMSIAKELEKRTPEGQKQPILLQVNTAQEESKSGFTSIEDVIEVVSHPWEKLEIQGLMAIPPYQQDPELSRQYFIDTRQWRDHVNDTLSIDLPHLSMGMSHDLEVAVAEGATIVRVGTAIFGPRS